MNRELNHRGFTLIEVVVSMAILAIGMSAGLGMALASQAGLEAGRRTSYATGLAQAGMEEAVSLPYAGLLEQDRVVEDELDGFRRTRTIRPDTPAAHLVTLQVVTTWRDRTGRPHRVRLVTIRSAGVVP
jgi:prepilin-type N-terminal cleavage/methylation domain-containing protein